MSHERPETVIRPIGTIRTPHHSPAGAPIQPPYAEQAEDEVIVDEHLEPALTDIEGFERVWHVYWFDRAGAFSAST